MKNYKKVVNERYNNEKKSVFNNVYSYLNNTGFYMQIKFKNEVCNIFKFLKSMELDFTQCKILDVGCGTGGLLRFIAELKGNCENLYGYDLSEDRIKRAKVINSNIKYQIGDITNYKIKDIKFDIIFAVDVFMHLNTIEQINNSLNNIKDMLSENGVFIWYDAYWDNHFNSTYDADACGYNSEEMEQYSKQIGFEKIYYNTIFKYLNNNVKFSTAYFGDKYPFWFIDMMEEKISGLPVNIVMIFKKVEDTNKRVTELKESIKEAIQYMMDNIYTEKQNIILELLENCKQAFIIIRKLKCSKIDYLLNDIVLIEDKIILQNKAELDECFEKFFIDYNKFTIT